MKKILLLCFIMMLCNSIQSQTVYYYYHEGEKISFTINTQYVLLSLSEPVIPEFIKNMPIKISELRSDMSERKQYQGQKRTSRYCAELQFNERLSEDQYFKLLAEIKQQQPDAIITPYVKYDNTEEKIGTSNFFYVKLRSEKDTTLLRKIAEKANCIIIEQDPFMPSWYVLNTTSKSERNAIESAAFFSETGWFLTAEPCLMTDLLQCATDPYFGNQWGLSNTGQFGTEIDIDIKVCDAWPFSTGSNVKVAIIDSGFDRYHPDLIANVFPESYDTSTGDTSIFYRNHGLNCAGIVGAVRNNNIGIAGVAPNCQLIAVSDYLGFPYPNAVQELASGINWAWQHGADVLSNSWSNIEYLNTTYIGDALSNATTLGRAGKGCVVACAAGNSDGGSVRYPALRQDVIAVGAADCNGQRASYSSIGTELDVVAPGTHIYTTASEDGYYYFTGTSAATPHVSGVAALILGANPDLTQSQVRLIIEFTAQKVGDYTYQIDPEHQNGAWNEEMGYGLVNAFSAVAYASSCVLNFINQTVTSMTPVMGCDDLNVQNVTVTNNASLILSAPGEITIDGPFEVQIGSTLGVQY
ncbi:MAG: S8 family serine peptidase [Dysgonamonadaceae bacterium]|jgi:subtilisin family serine protease|nr:S8 family serine peptidase [Dysgonamonadaceae bacterium]